MEDKPKPLGLLYKVYLYLNDRFGVKQQTKPEEIYAIEIAKKLTSHPDSELYIAPISNKRYIKNDSKQMFLVQEGANLTIVNHVYSYSVFIEDIKIFDEFLSLFNQILENKRLKIEEEMNKNITISLKTIMDNL